MNRKKIALCTLLFAVIAIVYNGLYLLKGFYIPGVGPACTAIVMFSLALLYKDGNRWIVILLMTSVLMNVIATVTQIMSAF